MQLGHHRPCTAIGADEPDQKQRHAARASCAIAAPRYGLPLSASPQRSSWAPRYCASAPSEGDPSAWMFLAWAWLPARVETEIEPGLLGPEDRHKSLTRRAQSSKTERYGLDGFNSMGMRYSTGGRPSRNTRRIHGLMRIMSGAILNEIR